MKLFSLTFFISFVVLLSSQAQVQQDIQSSSGFDKNKIEVGGSFGMVFGDYTAINVSPQIGYAFSPKFSAGGGISYNYYDYDSYRQTQNYLGLNLYARLRPIPYITLQLQPEFYSMWGSIANQSIDTRFVPCLLAGGGVMMPAGKGGISAMIYYDVIQDDWSPYKDQVVYSIGYVFNF